MRPLLLAALVVTLTAGCASAQPADAPLPAAMPADTAPAAPTELTEAERAVQALLAEDGVHVVHFWAPWCENSLNELAQGWFEVVESNPEVDFTFVTVWSDGAEGREALDRYAIPARVRVLTQPDGRAREARIKRFLGMPVTWIPTTWVFRDGGELAYAFNYGEMTMPQLQQALDGATRAW